MALNFNTSYLYATKKRWPQGKVSLESSRKHTLFSMMPRYANWTGISLEVVVDHTNPQGRSATYATAFAERDIDGAGNVFSVKSVQDYMHFGLNNETIEAAKDEGAVMDALVNQQKKSLRQIGNSAGHAIWRDGTGYVATVGSISGSTITLADPEDIVYFQPKQVLQLAASGSLLTGTPGYAAIVSVTPGDATSGTASVLTLDTAVTTAWTSAAAGNQILVRGDLSAKMSGVNAWIQGSAVSNTLFFGVDRSTNPEHLAGIVIPTTQGMIKDTLQVLLHRAGRNGGEPESIFLHGYDYQNLMLELGGHIIPVKRSVNVEGAAIGFDGVEIAGPTWKAQVFADYDTPRGQATALELDTWRLAHRGPSFIRMNEKDGNSMSRYDGSADAIYGNWFYYGNVYCELPGHNARATLGAA